MMESLNLKRSQWFQERLKSYPRALIIFYFFSIIILLVSAGRSASGLVDLMGYPLGRDFSHYWVASSLALAGAPGTVYNLPKFLAAQEDFFKATIHFAWFYPPTFLLMIYPLAWLPYLLSLVVWLGSTMSACVMVLCRIAPHRLTALLVLACPGTFVNIIFGQNGFLSAALLGGGLILLENNPLVGGFLLGLMSYKPHLFLLIPIALIAGRQWKALLGLFMGAFTLAAASFLVFGMEIWSAFFNNTADCLKLLEGQTLPIQKMTTIFAAALQYGASPRLAWMLQGSVSLGITALVAYIWYRETPFYLRAGALVLGILLATPYAFPYDLVMLMLPLAWLGWKGYTQGWLPWEPELLLFAWLSPLIIVALNFMGLNFFPPLILGTLLILVLRRIRIVRRSLVSK